MMNFRGRREYGIFKALSGSMPFMMKNLCGLCVLCGESLFFMHRNARDLRTRS
jgi:hypothetical protein